MLVESKRIPIMKIVANSLSPDLFSKVQKFGERWSDYLSTIDLQTSGSTGKKKQITAKKTHMIESAKMTGKFFGFSENSLLLHCLPIEFIAGKMMYVRIHTFNSQAIFADPSSPLDYPDELAPDFAAMTPFQYQKCLLDNRGKLEKIKIILLGGGPVSLTLEKEILGLSHEVYHSYGMTETYSHVALRKIGNSRWFTALEHISFGISSEKTLIIHAPKIGIEELVTNDLVELLNSKSFRFLGRKDFVINSGGIKIHPEEVERKIAPLLGEVNFFVFGMPDSILGEKLVLFLEQKDQPNLNLVNSALSKYERPKQVICLDSFVYTDTGKINRLKTVQKYFE
jgi:O-succinylbenzoic acid--CoA ligase